ncbi:calcium-responsive transcription factor [Discoglossus pictus]
MEMEPNGLGGDVVTQPTELMITCTSTEEVAGAAADMDMAQDTIGQQVAALTEQYHFIDQNGRTISYEIQALSDTGAQMMILATDSENGQVFHVIPSNQAGSAQLIIPQAQIQTTQDSLEHIGDDLQTDPSSGPPDNMSSFIIQSNATLGVSKKSSNRQCIETFQKLPQPLPPNIPVWARRLRSCERIGDSYRGYCLSEAELLSILGLHKQQTQSVWGTRQSPSPAKPATRLMWKSQYVPYDGIPFVNAGSRAIVMECQYGPRRKGLQPKRTVESDNASYKATCPARIYIKKVKKFPHYRVPTDPKIDKKLIRIEQEKAFNLLKKDLDGTDGVLRWYVQLPDQDAHQYHNLDTACFSPTPASFQTSVEEEEEVLSEEGPHKPSRLHPRVAEKIRELVSRGIEEVYAVRKQLRKFVERDLFRPDETPERHNLSYFPTVNDLKNHIHEAQKSLGNGELIYDPESLSGALQWTADNGNVLNEMVTVTFGSPPSEEQETLVKMENPTPEDVCQDTAQLLSSLTSLQPKIFAQLQPFRRAAWEVTIMCRVCKMFRTGLKGFRELLITGIGGSDDKRAVLAMEDDMMHGKMSFDHTLFKTRQDRFPWKAELITLKNPECRMENEIKFLRSLLQSLPSYETYSHHLQLLLAKVLRFERFERRRVIIKKGHIGHSFYFIYSGHVGVCNDEDGTSAFLDQEPILLYKGAKFGDIALIKGARRNATVVCMDTTEFLVVDKEDFFANKLDKELEKEFRYRSDFFSSLDLFSHWPAKDIEAIAGICQTRIFHHGKLVIQDTSETNSIAFVTEGSCELLRLVNLTKCPSYHKWLHRQIDFPLPNASPTQQPSSLCKKRFKGILLNSHSSLEPVYETPHNDSKMELKEKHVAFKVKETHTETERNGAQGTSTEHQDGVKIPVTPEGIPIAMAAAVFLSIDLLNPGQFLGLHEHLLPETQRDKRSQVLVSNGCKVILLKKEKFDEHCDEITKEKLQKYQHSYPSDNTLCRLFLQKNDWRMFKKDLVNLLLGPPATSQAKNKKPKKLIQTLVSFHRAGILDLNSISLNLRHRRPSESHKTIMIPTSGAKDGENPLGPDPTVRLVHAIAGPRTNLKRLLY